MRVAIIGGTGRFGSVLAWRLADAGHHVVIGSRDGMRALNSAGVVGALCQSGTPIEGALNRDAARFADVVLLTVPTHGHAGVLREIADVSAGKVVVDTCVCHHRDGAGRWAPPPEGSAALRARRLLPRTATVAATLHGVAARSLHWPRRHPPGDVLVASEGGSALEAAGTLLDDLTLQWWEAGDLEAAAALEQAACLLARLADRHGAVAPGLRLHGLPQRAGGRPAGTRSGAAAGGRGDAPNGSERVAASAAGPAE